MKKKKKRNTFKLHTHRVLLWKALEKRHLVFLDLEFSKKQHIYLDCPSCDTCLSNAFQQTNSERHLKNGKIWHQEVILSPNGLNSGETAEKFKLVLNNFVNQHWWLIKEEKWFRKNSSSPSSNTNTRFEIYLRFTWIQTNKMLEKGIIRILWIILL